MTFALYVLCLGVVVTALADVGASSLLCHFVPGSAGLAAAMRDFHTPGLAVVVPSIATGVVVLWAWNHLIG